MAERSGVATYHLTTDMKDENTMTMLYKLSEGCVKEEHYGLASARVVDLPPKVLEVADQVSRTITHRNMAKRKSSRHSAIDKRRKLVRGLKEQLEQLQRSDLDERELLNWLQKLQREFIQCMERIERNATTEEEESNDEVVNQQETSNIE